MQPAIKKMIPAARSFVAAAREAGWRVNVKPAFATAETNVVTITKQFPAGDADAFSACDGEWHGLLSMLKARGGSMWGTDGSGVGGHSAMLRGQFVMNASAVSDSMAKAVYLVIVGEA